MKPKLSVAPLLLAYVLGGVVATSITAEKVFSQPVSSAAKVGGTIPVTFKLDQAAFVTVVIENSAGQRVANLLSETYLPFGEHKVVWDGYDTGTEIPGVGWQRKRAAPGKHRVRGLTHDGLKTIYEMPVYSPGTPPWFTADGSGAWLADHSSPSSVLFLPSGSPEGGSQPQMLFGANVAEAGHALMWTDLKGRKITGTKVDGWVGGKALARDMGSQRDPGVYAYSVFVSNPEESKPNGSFKIFGLSASKEKPFAARLSYQPSRPIPHDGYVQISFAAHNGIGVVSSDRDDALLFVNLKTSKLIAKTPMVAPSGVHFDDKGRLWVLANKQLKRFDNATPAKAVLGVGKTIVSGLEEPHQIITDSSGQIYISNWGKTHQIKVFSPQGEFVRPIGKGGGLQIGAYDERQMHRPDGMAIDSNGTLWVAEDDDIPKRISSWNAKTGALLRAVYGGVKYGGGGTLDALDKTRLFYASYSGGMEFKLDWAKGTSKLVSVYMRSSEPQAQSTRLGKSLVSADLLPETSAPERRVVIGKHEYMINTLNGVYRGGQSAGIWKLKNGVALPVAFIGGGSVWFQDFFTGNKSKEAKAKPELAKFIEDAARAQGGKWDDVFATWSDLNGNHRLDINEWKVRVFPRTQTAYKNARGDEEHADFFAAHSLDTMDLAFTGGWSVQVPAPTINAQGIPIYDIEQARFALPPEVSFRNRDVGDLPRPWYAGAEGWLLQTPTRGYQNGVLRWTYPDKSGRFTPQRAGEVAAVNQVIGPLFKPVVGQAGQMFAQNSEKGAIFLMTVDGLFVQTLGGDMWQKPLWRMPQAKRGMEIKDVSYEDELFHPTITQTADGKVYLVVGKEHSSILRLDGLETIKRRDLGTITVTNAMVAGLPDRVLEGVESNERKSLDVSLGGKTPVVDGDLTDWNQSEKSWAMLDAKASGALKIANGRLYGAYRTDDANLLQNVGTQSAYLFKSGGALDLMLSTVSGENHADAPVVGDLRLLVTRVNNKPRATLYRAEAPNAPDNTKVVFTSPVGRVAFDEVRDVSAELKLAGRKGNYEFSIPLTTLDWKPESGEVYRGDIGLLRSNAGQTVQRLYWSNTNTAIVSDVPMEARLQPGNWGQFKVAGAGNKAE